MTTNRRMPLALLSGISLATALAGCAAQADAGAGDATTNDSGYADGTYQSTGTYESPAGKETIDVSVTLDGGVVSAVEVTPEATNPTSKTWQTAFASGVSDEVVGKAIDDVQLDAVSGASLTTGGFQDALDQIAADARG
ncbi:FMN-binding protein [Cellulomonas sp. URHB0016]